MSSTNDERGSDIPDSNLTETAADTILEIRDADVTFEMERGTSKVLNGASIDIHRDEILGVVGESGSGKSMFASALLNAVVEPGRLTGTIRYYPEHGADGIEILDLPSEELRRFRWEEIAMVFQGAQSSFNPTRNIRKHFIETLDAHDWDVEEGLDRAERLLEAVYLDPDRTLRSFPHELSGGMRQRTLIALSLLLEPKVLVMDEPTAALDLLMQRSIISLLEDIQNEFDVTIIFITHDLPLIANLADRMAVMYAFDFVEIGAATDIVNHGAHPYTRSLIKAIPNIDAPLDEMEPIAGSSPDPVESIPGCSYHPRCPLSDEQCEVEDPPLEAISSTQRAACHHWEHSEEAIPITHDPTEGSVTDRPRVDYGAAEPVVSMDDVSVHFKQSQSLIRSFFTDPQYVQAVDDIDLTIYENDVVALVGESGCGKTTLGKTAIAVQRPTKGRVEYRGQSIWDPEEIDDAIPFEEIRQALQIIHQDPGSSLNPNRTVQGILDAPQRFSQEEFSAEARYENIINLLERVGMTPPEEYAKRYPFQLSGGEKQRVALIRALLMNPDLILADEAVSALDVSLRVEMMDLMLDLQEIFDTSYLFISHNLANARYFAGQAGGRIGVMYMGELVEIGPVDEIIHNPQHPYTQTLRWSTPTLDLEKEAEATPLRSIDIPDQVNPPSGCRFHTRCPVAREACVSIEPTLKLDAADQHAAACLRVTDHEDAYQQSTPLDGATVDIEFEF